jgi:cytoskeletal protein RodZ
MSKGFISCNIAKQEEEYYSKIKQEYEYNLNTYNEKKDKQSNNFTMGIGGASGNLIFFIIFLAVGIIFLKKKPEEETNKKKKNKNKKKNEKKNENSNKSKMNKPVGIGLIVLAVLCFLSIGIMAFFIMKTINEQKELIKPVTPESYDYKRPCYSRKQSKMIGENEEEEDENDEVKFLSGVNLPRLPDAAQRMLSSSNSNTTNNDERGSTSSGANALKLSDVSGVTVTGTTVNNSSNKGGTFDAFSKASESGWDAEKDSSGDIVKSDGTKAGTTRETY